ncbi:hypothetical protein FOA52_004369 [Chlamydomonas sp. UWO 241]|nr:hypothetical protein FOA52_004369 [Chlamydomonas sp. UWO 241]
MAAVALLLVAWLQLDASGLLFLLLFLAHCVPAGLRSPRAVSLRIALWQTAAGVSSVLLLLQLAAQALYALHWVHWEDNDGVRWWCVLLGFTKVASSMQLLFATLPLAVTAPACWLHARKLRRHVLPPPAPPPALGAPIALVITALLWPCAAGLPYAVAIAACLVGWSWGGRLGLFVHPAPTLRLLQAYASAHVLLQYVHQAAPLRELLEMAPLAKALGLYLLDWGVEDAADWVPQALHLACLHLLIPAAAVAAARCVSAPVAATQQQQTQQQQQAQRRMSTSARRTSLDTGSGGASGGGGGAGGAGGSSLTQPLLPPPHSDPLVGVSTGVDMLPQGLGGVLGAALGACRSPVTAALALCCMAMLEVSVAGAACLVFGMLALLLPRSFGLRVLAAASPGASLVLASWFLGVYACTSLEAYYFMPPILQSLGLFMFRAPPAVCLPMAMQLLAVVPMAVVSRKQLSSTPSTLVSTPHTLGVGGAHRTLQLSAPWQRVVVGSVAAAWLIGFVTTPASWVALGLLHTSALNAAYIFWCAAYFGWLLLRGAPRRKMHASVGLGGTSACCALSSSPPSHPLPRLFASLHLLALYAAMCDQLPGLEYFRSEELEKWLRVAGLWDPGLASHCIPVLLSLLITTLHAKAGAWLQKCTAPPPSTPHTVHTSSTPGDGAAALMTAPTLWAVTICEGGGGGGEGGGGVVGTRTRWEEPALIRPAAAAAGGAAVSLGWALVPCVGIPLVVFSPSGYVGVPPGLVCAGHLLLLPLLLLSPPGRDDAGDCGDDSSGRQRVGGATYDPHTQRARWLLPAFIALYCLAELAAQYGLSLAPVLAPGCLSPSTLSTLRDLVGIVPAASTAELALALVRPLALLVALQVWRACFEAWEPRARARRGGSGVAAAAMVTTAAMRR